VNAGFFASSLDNPQLHEETTIWFTNPSAVDSPWSPSASK